MTIAVGNVLRFVAKFDILDGQEMNLVFHQKVTAGATESDLVVLTALRDHLNLAFVGMEASLHDSFHSTECELYVYDFVAHQFNGTAQIGWTTTDGGSAVHALANQDAALVKFFTAVGRRQARKYISGYTEGLRNGNTWEATALGQLAAWAAILDDALIAGAVTVVPCTFNLDVASLLYETDELFNGVTAVDTFSSTQRRRKPGVGI